jgi:UDP-N-acetylmuramate dehydrogenase
MESLLSIEKEKPLSFLCSLKIGGKASYYSAIHTIEDFQKAFLSAKSQNMPYFILGNGTNILFDDQGYQGLILHNKISYLNIEKEILHVGGGFSFARLGKISVENHLSGLEFATSIPGTVGGAIFMNAGAFQQKVSDPLVSIEYVTSHGELISIKKEDILFGYRSSSLQEEKGAIVGATFQLIPSLEAQEKAASFHEQRKRTQPQKVLSAGCVFRNPNTNLSAGYLIEKAGLKNFSIGGAKVSEKHANFLINDKNASSKDFLSLIEHVQKKVFECTGYELQKEIIFLPYDKEKIFHPTQNHEDG